MEFVVSNHINLENIPNGSGIAKSGDNYYGFGGDSPFSPSLRQEF